MPVDVLDENFHVVRQKGAEAKGDSAADLPVAAFRQMRRYSELTGLSFLCVDAATGRVLAKTNADTLVLLSAEVRRELPNVEKPRLLELRSGLIYYLLPLPCVNHSPAVAAGYTIASPNAVPEELVLAAAEQNWSQPRLDCWVARQSYTRAELMEILLQLVTKEVEHESRQQALEQEIEVLSDQIASTYEEISLLHTLTQKLQISRSPVELAELCLQRMHTLIESAGCVIWMQEKTPVRIFSSRARCRSTKWRWHASLRDLKITTGRGRSSKTAWKEIRSAPISQG